MRNQLVKSMRFGESLDMMYMSNGGVISKRRIKVLQLDGETFKAYCHLRKAKRTFKVENILALVPVTSRESMVI